MNHHRTILVVEDDPAIRRGLVDSLEFAEYRVIEAANGDEGLRRAIAVDVDLVILDVIMPKRSGFEVLQEIRRCKPRLPVILVTARGAEPDRIHGLKHGADDYVVKPFSANELLARVEAVLRRSAERPLDVQSAQIAGCDLDFARREIRRPDGEVVGLSDKELDILRYLVANPGRAIPRAELLQRLWGFDPAGVQTRTIDMHVLRLREKLGDDAEAPRAIVTVRGVGYKLVQPEAR